MGTLSGETILQSISFLPTFTLGVNSYKERICSHQRKFFPLRVDSRDPEMRDIEDNSKIISFISMKTCHDSSLDPSQRDGSYDGSQNMFKWLNMNALSLNYLLPLLIWSTD